MKKWSEGIEIGIVTILALVVLYERVLFAFIRRVMPAGDTFNFINASQWLAHFKYPIGEKRLPFYPFLIMIGSWFSDPIVVAVSISIISSVLTVIFLYLVGKKLGISSIVLGIVLILAAVQPNLTIIGIRPLADGLSLALLLLSLVAAAYSRPTYSWAVALGGIFTAAMLTRYENIILVGIIGLVLGYYWRKHLRELGVLVITIAILFIPWLVLSTQAYGAPWRIPYTEEVRSDSDSWAATSWRVFSNNLITLADNTGFAAPWIIPRNYIEEAENNEIEEKEIIPSIFSNSMWWLSLLALLGTIGIAMKRTQLSTMYLGVFIVYALVSAWWGPTFRFSSPLWAFWLIAVAAGGMIVTAILARLVPKGPSLIVAALFIPLVSQQVFPFAKEAHNRASDDNGRGYAVMQAIRDLTKTDCITAYGVPTLMASSYLGGDDWSRYVESRALPLDAYATTSANEIYDLLKENEVTCILHQDEEYLTAVIKRLQEEDKIVQTNKYENPTRAKEKISRAIVYEIQWD